MDHQPTFSVDAVSRSWTEKPTWPGRRWAVVALVSIGLHLGLAGWLWLREAGPVGSTSTVGVPVNGPALAMRSMVVTMIGPSTRTKNAIHNDAAVRPRAITLPSTTRATSVSKAPAVDTPSPSAVTSSIASQARHDSPVHIDPAGPTASAALPNSPNPPASATTSMPDKPLDLSLPQPSSPRRLGDPAPMPPPPWFDDLRRPGTPSGRPALTERRTNDGVQLRRGEDCVELRQSRQSMLDPFSAANRPAARGLQPCD